MSAKHIIVLVVLGLANLCVLGVGFALLMTPPPAQPVATPVPFEAGVMATASAPPPPTNTASPLPPSLTPTNTRWPTWTPEPTQTPYPTFTFLGAITQTQTPAVTQATTTTLGLKTPAAPKAPTPTKSAALPATPKPAVPPGGSTGGCDNPPSGQLGGKLDVAWSYLSFVGVPNTDNAQVTMQIFATGGNGCYKYSMIGVVRDHQPISFIVRQCAGTPVSLIVTSRDGQTWKQDFIVEVTGGEGFKCK